MTELLIKAVLVKQEPIYLNVIVSQRNQRLIREKLMFERAKIVAILKNYKREKIIRSVFIPKNKAIQKELNALVQAKRTIDDSINRIRTYFA